MLETFPEMALRTPDRCKACAASIDDFFEPACARHDEGKIIRTSDKS
jgi:hypothetical protein